MIAVGKYMIAEVIKMGSGTGILNRKDRTEANASETKGKKIAPIQSGLNCLRFESRLVI